LDVHSLAPQRKMGHCERCGSRLSRSEIRAVPLRQSDGNPSIASARISGKSYCSL
jgi:hypothetical protein